MLLISDHFLSSDFIRNHEQGPLLKRRDDGMVLVPVLIGACPWRQIGWLEGTQMRPGDKPLDLFGGPGSPKVKKEAAAIVDEMTNLLKQATPRTAARTRIDEDAVPPAEAASALLEQVLLSGEAEAARGPLAKQLVAEVARCSGLSDQALFNAVRLFIEFQLLRAPDPFSPQALLDAFAAIPQDRIGRALLDSLRGGAATGNYAGIGIEVGSKFIMNARQREGRWQAYFAALRDPHVGGLADEAVGTLARVDSKVGFLAPQHLVAGLMSRFDDDWRPVLAAYRKSLPEKGALDGGYANLRASQWNCWLVWGPSVPICRCAQWRRHYAFQYGYGDENNSLPLLDTSAEAGQSELDALAAQIVQVGAQAGSAPLTGRLRWGPYALRAQAAPDDARLDADDTVDPDDPSDDGALARPAPRWSVAAAQASLLCGEGRVHAEHHDGLMLELEALKPAKVQQAYYSAYLWMMFLVAGPIVDPAGPRLLWGRRIPDWPETADDRYQVRAAQLWRDLLPVFVHANVADAAALQVQRRVLVATALAMLRGLWERRESSFRPEDLQAGLRFHLACASDYSGCGEEIRFPATESLSELMRAQLAGEPDREFAGAVVLPEAGADRPWGMAGYFSSCHLHEIVSDYHAHVALLGRR
jgi:hypothetical protein